MPQATTLRLIRGTGPRAITSASAHVLVQRHMMHVQQVHTIASRLASDAELLVEALRFFRIGSVRR